MPVNGRSFDNGEFVPMGTQQRLRIEELEAALRFYADPETWALPDDPMAHTTPADEDSGERARSALNAR